MSLSDQPATPLLFRTRLRREQPFAACSRLFGVTDANACMEVHDETLEIRFGPWHLRTPLANVVGARVTGPYRWWKVIGPAHVSLKDRGVTFATTNKAGVCITFREPVPALDPKGLIRHPGATVTVENPEEVVRVLTQATAA